MSVGHCAKADRGIGLRLPGGVFAGPPRSGRRPERGGACCWDCCGEYRAEAAGRGSQSRARAREAHVIFREASPRRQDLPSVPVSEVDRGFVFEGFGEIAAAVERGQGPILALPHLGTWEWAAWWLALVPEFKVTAVVEPLEPPELFEWFVGFRESLGMDIVPLGPDAAKTSIQALKQGQVLCLLADRDIAGNGVPVEFFGERTTLPAGPATLALRTGSPLIPSAVYWRGNTRHAICTPPLDTTRHGRLRADVARVTQDLARDFEYLISQAPEQWHMLSPNWPSDYQLLGLPLPEHLRGL